MKTVSVLVTVASLILPAPDKTTYVGYAAHYRPGVMQRVAENRGMSVVDCMVASPYHPLGTWLVVTSKKSGYSKVCRVTDLPHPRDRKHIIKRGIVVELDFTSAKQLCGIRYAAQEPPRACPVIVSIYEPKPKVEPEPKPRPKPPYKPARLHALL